MSEAENKEAGRGEAALLCGMDGRGVATVTLNRPELHNAFDDKLIAALTETFERLDHDTAVRAVVLRGAGKSFSAGADLNWMRRMAGYSEAENLADARSLARMLKTVDGMAKPVVAVIHGNCYAGAIGLVACADIAIAADDARFSLSEVRLGLAPATIGPYVVRAMGARNARRYFLTAERFDAHTAMRLGLVHEVVPLPDLDAAVERVLAALLSGGPDAQRLCKEIIAAVSQRPIDANMIDYTVRMIAEVRASAEGREGLAAFFEKRNPRWASNVR